MTAGTSNNYVSQFVATSAFDTLTFTYQNGGRGDNIGYAIGNLAVAPEPPSAWLALVSSGVMLARRRRVEHGGRMGSKPIFIALWATHQCCRAAASYRKVLVSKRRLNGISGIMQHALTDPCYEPNKLARPTLLVRAWVHFWLACGFIFRLGNKALKQFNFR